MILPPSHSPSVIKPSQAMGAARGDPAGGEIPMRPFVRAIGNPNKHIICRYVRTLANKIHTFE